MLPRAALPALDTPSRRAEAAVVSLEVPSMTADSQQDPACAREQYAALLPLRERVLAEAQRARGAPSAAPAAPGAAPAAPSDGLDLLVAAVDAAMGAPAGLTVTESQLLEWVMNHRRDLRDQVFRLLVRIREVATRPDPGRDSDLAELRAELDDAIAGRFRSYPRS